MARWLEIRTGGLMVVPAANSVASRPAMLNPMTWQVDLLRFSLLGTGDATPLALEAGAFLAFSAISLVFAVRALNRVA